MYIINKFLRLPKRRLTNNCLRATILKKGAVPKIDYFKYDFFPTFFFLCQTQVDLKT